MRRPVGVKWVLLFFRWTSFSLRRVATVATLPSALFVERFWFARCKLGVLISAGAAQETLARRLVQKKAGHYLGRALPDRRARSQPGTQNLLPTGVAHRCFPNRPCAFGSIEH